MPFYFDGLEDMYTVQPSSWCKNVWSNTIIWHIAVRSAVQITGKSDPYIMHVGHKNSIKAFFAYKWTD